MNILVRNMELGDFERLKEIDIAEQKKYLGDKWDSLSIKIQESHLVITHPQFEGLIVSGFSFVVLVDGIIAGFIVAFPMTPYANEVFIKYVCVFPDFRRMGLASTLYEALTKRAKDMGVTHIWSLINLDNPPSIDLHRKKGFALNDRIEATLEIS